MKMASPAIHPPENRIFIHYVVRAANAALPFSARMGEQPPEGEGRVRRNPESPTLCRAGHVDSLTRHANRRASRQATDRAPAHVPQNVT